MWWIVGEREKRVSRDFLTAVSVRSDLTGRKWKHNWWATYELPIYMLYLLWLTSYSWERRTQRGGRLGRGYIYTAHIVPVSRAGQAKAIDVNINFSSLSVLSRTRHFFQLLLFWRCTLSLKTTTKGNIVTKRLSPGRQTSFLVFYDAMSHYVLSMHFSNLPIIRKHKLSIRQTSEVGVCVVPWQTWAVGFKMKKWLKVEFCRNKQHRKSNAYFLICEMKTLRTRSYYALK